MRVLLHSACVCVCVSAGVECAESVADLISTATSCLAVELHGQALPERAGRDGRDCCRTGSCCLVSTTACHCQNIRLIASQSAVLGGSSYLVLPLPNTTVACQHETSRQLGKVSLPRAKVCVPRNGEERRKFVEGWRLVQSRRQQGRCQD